MNLGAQAYLSQDPQSLCHASSQWVRGLTTNNQTRPGSHSLSTGNGRVSPKLAYVKHRQTAMKRGVWSEAGLAEKGLGDLEDLPSGAGVSPGLP